MTQFEYYSHNKMSQVKKDFTPTLIKELKSFLVERMVDNMSTKDLVAYVMDDLDRYYDNMLVDRISKYCVVYSDGTDDGSIRNAILRFEQIFEQELDEYIV